MTQTPSDLADFLTLLGLSSLIKVFEDEDVDMQMLALLDKSDLKELGLTLGQRKKIELGLAARSGRARGPATPRPTTPDETPIQLRRLSVLFCDIVGSTSLGETLSIDQMQALLQHYYDLAHEVAQDHEGYLSGTQGDGVVLLFGFPRVIEGIAERSIQAARALQTALAETPLNFDGHPPVFVRTRIGIATGQAAVGQADDALSSDQMHLVGPVVNRAARLQTVARPGMIVVDAKTRELTQDHVLYADPETHQLKGLPDDQEVSHVLGLKHGAVETEGRHLIGRIGELRQLAQIWDRTKAGHTEIVTLSGDAGIGKSAVLGRFANGLQDPGARIIRLSGASIAAQSPFWPIADYLDRKLAPVPQARRLSTLAQLLAPSASAEITGTDAAALAHLLDLETLAGEVADGAATLDRGQSLKLFTNWIAGDGAAPTLLILDNAQWVDDSTKAVLRQGAAVARASGKALLIVTAGRGSGDQIWDAARDDVTALPLGPLSRDEATRLLRATSGTQAVPQSLRNNVLDHASGNPLMLETLGRSLAERRLGALSDEMEIPFTIYESVSSRLNDIRSGRRLIEALAVLDAPTDAFLLETVAGDTEGSLAEAIAALEAADLMSRVGHGDAARFQIPHQVYRDVVYEQIAGSSRLRLHHRAFEALSAHTAEAGHGAAAPERLAHHANAAQAHAETVHHALAAGETFLRQSALIEASHYFSMANNALDKLPEDDAATRNRLRCVTGLASIERSRFGIATDKSAALGQQTADLARGLGDTQAELLALNGLYAHALVGANYPLAEARAQDLRDRAQRYGDATFTMIGTRATGAVAFHRADYPKARDCLQSALDAYDRDRHLPLAHAHGYDHAEICAAFLSMTLWMQGDLHAAARLSDLSVDHSRHINHAHSLAQAMAFRVMLGALARDVSDANRFEHEATALCEKHGIAVMRSAAVFFPFATRLSTQSAPVTAEEIARLGEYQKAFKALNPFNYAPLVATLMAEIQIAAGRLDAADAALKDGVQAEQRTGETWTAPELVRLRAALHWHRGDTEAARTLRRIALESANASGAQMIALRVACDMQDAEPGAEHAARVADLLSRLPSDVAAWDLMRARALLQSARRA